MGREFDIWETKLWFFFSVESLTLTKMSRLIITQHIKIIKAYYKNGDSLWTANFWKFWTFWTTHFTLGGCVNKQNCCIWSPENLQVIKESPLHPEKVTVCCALWSEGVIGPYFFENEDGTTVTVNSERYGHMINGFFFFVCY